MEQILDCKDKEIEYNVIQKLKSFYPPDLSNKQEVRFMDVWKAVCAFVALLRKERKELPDDPERKKELFDRIEHDRQSR